MSWSIRPLQDAEVSRLTAIKAAAFGPDPLQNLMFPPIATEKSYGPWAEELYRRPMKLDGSCRIMGAVDADSGKVVGVAVWHFYNSSGDFDVAMAREKSSYDLPMPQGSNPELWNKFVGAMKESRHRNMAGKPFYLLKLLVIDPIYQGKGAGSALIRYGIDLADQARVCCCLEASPDGFQLYKRFGFQRVEDLTLDLRPYGYEGEWNGVVMVRKPSPG